MAIQYYMRAYNTTLSKYVDWVVNDTPDSTGTFSGFPTNQLINITVNRIVQSKVSNFLKQNQSLGGVDGYYFHVNSYDWRNATAPILPPSTLVGFAVERGIASVTTLTGATNATPIAVTTAVNHNLSTGQVVTISGVTGNVAANGTWPIIVTSPSTFTLAGSSGTGTYNAGTGTAYIPSDMSSLTWDETNNVWRLAFVTKNNPGDSVTLGASQSLKVNNFIVDGYIAIGPDPADTGPIRLSNNTYIFSESNPAGADVQLIGADTLNRIKLGVNTTDIVYDPGVLVVDGYIQHDGTGSNTAQTTGFIREQNSTNIIAFRGTAALAGSDIVALASSSNNVVLGDSVNTGVIYNTSGSSIHQFQVNSASKVEIGDPFIRFFPSGLAGAPTIFQSQAAANISGQTLTIQAQNGGTGTSNGGILALTSGTGAGVNPHGTVDLLTGGILQMRVFPDTNAGLTNGVSNNNSILYFQNALRFDTAMSAPTFTQDQVNATSTNGQTLTVQSQNAIGATSVGGNINISSGTGTTRAGQVSIQTGTVPQIVIIPNGVIPASSVAQTNDLTVIAGNFEVKGTLTTIDSTSVDIIGRVIHANWADPVASPTVGVPTQIAGYSIHRGNVSGIARDGAAWIWTEGAQNSGADGYWRAVTIPGDGGNGDGYTISNSLNILGVMGSDYSASNDPNPIGGYLGSTGGFRTYNNVPATVARTNLATTTLSGSPLSNGTFTLPYVAATVTVVDTTNFTTAGSLLVQSSAGQQLVTYTGKTGTTFTGVNGGTGTVVTGGIVSQVNNSTTIAAPSNGANLPQATINVVSTTGFPASGTLRIAAQTTNLSTSPQSVQTIAYTGTTATTFTGCTGGTGFLFTGDAVTLAPIPGTADLVLLGTDFGNRILHGAPTANTGHIFNTPSGLLPPYIPYDFQVNSVTQVQLAQVDVDASGFSETIQIGPTVNTPRLVQQTLPNTGATNGFSMGIFAQSGQQQTGVTANNNGGQLFLVSGAQGTGGSGAAGIDGYVELRTGFTSKMRVFPTFALSAADNNSILYFENLFRVDANQTNPVFRQDTTGSGVGQIYTIQAQNAATTGGNLVLTSGTGSLAANAGQVKLETGGIDRVIVYPTGSPALPQGSSGIAYTEFRDSSGPAAFITPVSSGISSIGFNSTVTGVQIAQVATTTTNGAPMTIQAQVSSFNGGTGGNLVLIAGNETGTTSTGGNVNILSGTGTSTNGVVNIQIAGTQTIAFNKDDVDGSGFAEVMGIANTIVNPRIYQIATGGASGTILALMAQNATTTGGPLQLHSGTGGTNDGYINLTTGNTVKMTIYPTVATVAANNNSIQIFENKVRFDTAQVTPLIRQDDRTVGATGETLTLQAQNDTAASSTGGALVLTSGTGTTVAGNTQIQTGGVDRVVVHPTFTEFRDTAEALRITPVSAGTTQITFAATDTAAQINQTFTPGATGATMTVAAQAAATTGGNLFLTAGSGGTTDGYVALQTGGVTTAYATTNKFAFSKGWRRNVTSVSGTYQILVSDDYIAATTSSAYTVTMPATPTTGDSYTIKDASGGAGTNTLTIAGNGVNIDGSASMVLNQAYAAVTLTYTGSQWSVT